MFISMNILAEEAILLFVREVTPLGRLPFNLTEEDLDIVRKFGRSRD